LETLKEIQRQAAARHGGPRALEEMLPRAKTRAALRRIPDDRWLSSMTRAVFQAGFVWRIVEHKWPGFEEAFDGFDPKRVAQLSEKRLGELTRDPSIIRNPQKVRATRDNARLLVELAAEHGSAARCFADWPEQDIVGLWDLLKRRGSRLGGNTGPYFLRSMGKDTPILTPDVVRALRDQEVIEQKSLTSKRAQRAVQDAFNAWREESGRSLCEISRILACSVGS
jgi:3-methyladenine DNA glycosylase Tag